MLGDPAAGKATQAARLIKKYRLYDLDMGREVNKPAMRKKYDYARTTGIGHLTPTGVVRDIFRNVIRTAPRERGILFNGTPKMIGEAKLVAKWLKQYKRSDPFFMYLSIPMAEILRRAKLRTVYVNGKRKKRDDDSERAIRNRKRYYEQQVSQTVAFFKKRYAFKKISGVGTREAVWRKIDAALRAFSKKTVERDLHLEHNGD